jgi:hypothetical protein
MGSKFFHSVLRFRAFFADGNIPDFPSKAKKTLAKALYSVNVTLGRPLSSSKALASSFEWRFFISSKCAEGYGLRIPV